MADRDNSGALFKTVPCAPDYEVSEAGVVRRAAPGTSTKPGKVLKPYVRPDGYQQMTLRHEGRNVVMLVHRIVALTFLGEAPSAVHEVAHADGDRQNNSLSNLRWALHRENQADMRRHGRAGQGVAHWAAKITEDQVRQLREARNVRGAMSTLARQWGISPKQASKISLNNAWRHVAQEGAA